MKKHLFLLLLTGHIAGNAQPICGHPGDANHDGRSDYLDAIAVGLTYNQLFEPRPVQGNNWALNCFEPWFALLPGTNINAGFSDSNGNGKVDSLDIDAIALNYDSITTQGVPPPIPWQPQLNPDIPCPLIRLELRKDDLNERKFYADIFFEADPTVFPGALGLGMEIIYDPTFIENDSVKILFLPENTDLMGAGSAPEQVSFQRSLPPGLVELAVAGRGQNALLLPRKVAVVEYIVIQEVILRSADTIEFQIDFGDVVLVNALGERICTEQKTGLLKMIVGEQEPLAPRSYFQLYPNPATTYFRPDLPPDAPPEIIRLLDMNGQLVRSYQPAPVLPLDGVLPGVYVVQVQYAGGSVWKKLVVGPH